MAASKETFDTEELPEEIPAGTTSIFEALDDIRKGRIEYVLEENLGRSEDKIDIAKRQAERASENYVDGDDNYGTLRELALLHKKLDPSDKPPYMDNDREDGPGVLAVKVDGDMEEFVESCNVCSEYAWVDIDNEEHRLPPSPDSQDLAQLMYNAEEYGDCALIFDEEGAAFGSYRIPTVKDSYESDGSRHKAMEDASALAEEVEGVRDATAISLSGTNGGVTASYNQGETVEEIMSPVA